MNLYIKLVWRSQCLKIRQWCWWWIRWRSWIQSWGWSCINKYVTYDFNVKIDESVYWDVDRIVSYKVGRGNIDRVDIGVGS